MDWFACGSDILRDPRTYSFAAALNRSRPEAVGFLAGVYGLLARHGNESGSLAGLADDTIEEEALWKGRRGLFAATFRTHYTDDEGNLKGWKSWNGAAIAKAKRDRARKKTERMSRNGARQSAVAGADVPRSVHGTGAGAARVHDMTGQDTQTTTTTTGDSPVGARRPTGVYPAFVADVVDRWTAEVGGIEPGRIAKDMQQLYRIHGTVPILAAVGNFAKHRSLAVRRGDAKPDGWPQFIRDFRDYVPREAA